jgi:hypothetical protein
MTSGSGADSLFEGSVVTLMVDDFVTFQSSVK